MPEPPAGPAARRRLPDDDGHGQPGGRLLGRRLDRRIRPAWPASARATESTVGTGIPSWFIQQSIARELLPEGVDAEDHPGHRPHRRLRPARAAPGRASSPSARSAATRPASFDIGADADHAIIAGKDEDELQASLALNKLAMAEARDYTKFTVDTSQLFGYPVELETPRSASSSSRPSVGGPSTCRTSCPASPASTYRFDDAEILALGRKYWQACAIHRELFDYCVELKAGAPFDYELSLDETPAPAPADELLFYLVVLEEICGIPAAASRPPARTSASSSGATTGGDVEKELYPLTNACASIMADRGIAFSVHSGDGASPFSGRGSGVDMTVGKATGRKMELKLSDIYQEILWHAMAYSDFPVRARALRARSGRRLDGRTAVLARAYEELVVGKSRRRRASGCSTIRVARERSASRWAWPTRP